jgi:RNA polymerase sigma-70 factor, ECF subfamily
VGCPHTADEAAQEAIVRAWRYRDSCRQPEQPHGWLRRIAHNEAVRVAGRRPNEVLVEEPLAAPNGQVDDEDSVEERLLFGAILGTLSQADQELARLRYYEDLTCATLAEHFGLSEATVKVRLHRLRRRIRQRLEAQT